MAFAASWTDLTEDAGYRSVPLEQRGGDVFFVIHHAVNRLVQDTIALSKPGGKQVSMTWAIGPTSPGVQSPIYCVNTVAESRRPYTTASSIDDKAVTVEVSNVDLSATYPVAQEAKEWCAKIAAYMHLVYRMPLDRWHVTSHQEVYARGWGSYATACPGPDLQGALDWIVARAQQIVAGGGGGGDDMTIAIRIHPNEGASKGGGTLGVFSDGRYTHLSSYDPATLLKTAGWSGDGNGYLDLLFEKDVRGSFHDAAKMYVGLTGRELLDWIRANPGKTYVAEWARGSGGGGGSYDDSALRAKIDELTALVTSLKSGKISLGD